MDRQMHGLLEELGFTAHPRCTNYTVTPERHLRYRVQLVEILAGMWLVDDLVYGRVSVSSV